MILQDLKNLYLNRSIINQFTKREIVGRYKGAFLGIIWSFITPLFMLTIYTFVFSVVFKTRWGNDTETSKVEFALVLFAGLIVFNILSEVVSKAPSLIISNVNYVKKVVFPLEILPITVLGSALFHSFISIVILSLGVLIFMGTFNWMIVLIPIILLPVCLFSLGLGWFLSSLGVYLRDVNQIIGVALPALMFLSPIFYPISLIPQKFQIFYYLNPISYVVEDLRRVMIWGVSPNWGTLLLWIILGVLFAVLCFVWFKKTKGGFADVL